MGLRVGRSVGRSLSPLGRPLEVTRHWTLDIWYDVADGRVPYWKPRSSVSDSMCMSLPMITIRPVHIVPYESYIRIVPVVRPVLRGPEDDGTGGWVDGWGFVSL